MTTLADTVIGVAAFAVAGLVGRDRPDANRGSRATGGTRIGVRRSTRPPERRMPALRGRKIRPQIRPGEGRESRLGRLVQRGRLGDRGLGAARWARPADLRSLMVKGTGGSPAAPPGRLVLGVVGKRVISAEPRQSVIVFGPSQSRKTSGFAVPAILGWEGPVIAASIKADLVGDTMAYRRSRGDVACFDPTGSTGLPAVRWSPLPMSRTWP